MKELKRIFKLKNIGCGYLYFYLHFITEIACFYFLTKYSNGNMIVWLVPFAYDALAFVPQSIIGYFSDKHPKINLSFTGFIMMFIALILYEYTKLNVFIPLFIIAIGNALVHVNGAEVTLKNSEGKLSHSAIFVSGGSFGVIAGKVFATYNVPVLFILFLIVTTIPFVILADTYKNSKKEYKCSKFNYVDKKLNPMLVVILAVLVVIIRGYMGYGIPTSWNKSMLETVYLFCIMGLGKALGGILSDRFGIRNVALCSTLLAIPFLCLGDKIMLVSLIGVMFFSMTMSITLGILVSVLPNKPGLAFGLTTIGLFLGTAPIFFIKINQMLNIIFIIIMSILCAYILLRILRREKND